MIRRILVAEDEMIVAFDLCNTVEEAGFEVEGPHAGISSAMQAFQKAKPDLAILDVELHDGVVFPLAHKLCAEHVPIIFYSEPGSRAQIEAQFPSATTLIKPCPPADMLEAVNAAFAQAGMAD